jgi:hypothetical protein
MGEKIGKGVERHNEVDINIGEMVRDIGNVGFMLGKEAGDIVDVGLVQLDYNYLSCN